MTLRLQNFLSAGALLSAALLAGRISGFGRELLLANGLGLSAQADMAVILLTVPDLLVNLLLSGGIGVALVPLLRSQNDAQAALLLRQAGLLVGGLFTVLGLAFALWPNLWLGLLAPGMDIRAQSLGSYLSWSMAGAIVLTALAGVTTAALNSREHFFVAGCGTLIFNAAIILALLWMLWQQSPALNVLGVGILAGALLRWLTQWLALRTLRKQSGTAAGWLIDRRLLKGFAAGLIAASLLTLVPVVLRACASWLGEGQLAAFNYAIKLVELPLGILITTITTITFPRLSAAFHEKNGPDFDRLLAAALARSLLVSTAVVLCGWPVMDVVVRLLFSHSKLDAPALAHVTALTRIALLSVPVIGFSGLLAAALNAQRKPGRVMHRTLLALLALPLLCLPGLLANRPDWVIYALPGFYFLLCASLLVGGNCFMQKRLWTVRWH